MFVTRARFDRMEADARVLSAIGKALAEQLHTAAAERDEARKKVEQLNGTVAFQSKALTQHQAHIVDLETQLSACWIRNARGHFERHPMNKAPGQ